MRTCLDAKSGHLSEINTCYMQQDNHILTALGASLCGTWIRAVLLAVQTAYVVGERKRENGKATQHHPKWGLQHHEFQ
jgi:hypothetical protein